MFDNAMNAIPFLQSYPTWVVRLTVVWLALTAVLLASLLLAPRKPAVAGGLVVDAFRRFGLENGDAALKLELLVRNLSGDTAQLVELELEFYEDGKPTGGLMSSTSESAMYYVIDHGTDPGALIVEELPGDRRYEVDVVYPFAGQEYAELRVPLSRPVTEGATDRFSVILVTEHLPKASHRKVDARIKYNGDRLTERRTLALSEH